MFEHSPQLDINAYFLSEFALLSIKYFTFATSKI